MELSICRECREDLLTVGGPQPGRVEPEDRHRKGYISRLEKGPHVVSYKTIEKIAKALGVRKTLLNPGFDDESHS